MRNRIKKGLEKARKLKICKRIFQFITIILLIGIIFYGFILLPRENYNLNYQRFIISNLKSERSCELLARQDLVKIQVEAKKNNKEITKEQESKFLNDSYLQCLYIEGLYTPVQKLDKKTGKEQGSKK